jgi:hypothetical protein
MSGSHRAGRSSHLDGAHSHPGEGGRRVGATARVPTREENTTGKLHGKVAIVTGAGRGLGHACAHRLASLGATAAVCDRDLKSYKEFEVLARGFVRSRRDDRRLPSALHRRERRDQGAPKVFKLARRRLQPGKPITILRRHVFEHVSIRADPSRSPSHRRTGERHVAWVDISGPRACVTVRLYRQQPVALPDGHADPRGTRLRA